MTMPTTTRPPAGADPLLTALARLAQPAPPALAERVAETLELGDRYVAVDAPPGRVTVAFSARGFRLLELTDDEDEFHAAYAARFGDQPLRRGASPPPELVPALWGRSPRRPLRYDLSGMSAFQQAVLQRTATIPRGEVRPYSWVAREAGQPSAVRAAGTALARNPVPLLIPCHRVVRSDGRLGNYALGPPLKSRLLEGEGVDLDDLADLASGGMRYVGSSAGSTFCLPTCAAARRIDSSRRVTFRSAEQAAAAGYRPCRRCRPVVLSSTA